MAIATRNGAQSGLTQEEARKKREQLARGNAQAPSAVEMNSFIFDLVAMQSSLGMAPFSARRIPLAHLYEMRTDAVLAFAALFARMPLLSARWFFECKSARKAAFMTEALKQIYGRFVLQWTSKWDFGWQALVKQFRQVAPDWTFIDSSKPEAGPQQIWDEGDIPAVIWEPFVPLKPETVTPRWNIDGSFGGINLRPGWGGYAFPTRIASDGATGQDKESRYVDVDHSLWTVNERDFTFGSVWGFPRLSRSYKYWWAYEMLLGILYRSGERKGDPTVKVRYPEGKSTNTEGEPEDNREIAFRLGQQARSGAVLAISSEVYMDSEDRLSREPMWDVDYLTGGELFTELVEILQYIDTLKIRSQLEPEQALTEGRGGTSSRNVAQQMGEQGQRMAITAMTELADDINTLLVPQLDELNFPELRGMPARFTFKDLGSQDLDLYSTLLQGLANKDATVLNIDWDEILQQLGIPTLAHEAIAKKQADMAKEASTQKTPELKAVPGGKAGVDADGLYYDAPDLVEFAGDNTFINVLPDSKHFKDRGVIATARLLRKLMKDRFADQYKAFADYLESDEVSLAIADFLEADLVLADLGIEFDDDGELLLKENLNVSPAINWVEKFGGLPDYIVRVAKDIHEGGRTIQQAVKIAIGKMHTWAAGIHVKPETARKAADALAEWYKLRAKAHANRMAVHASDDSLELASTLEERAQKAADRIMAHWTYETPVSKRTTERAEKALADIFSRAGKLELQNVRLPAADWKPGDDKLLGWVSDNAAAMVSSVDETTRTELHDFLVDAIKEDKNATEIADDLRKQFSDFPGWKADRVARTEVRKFYNAATLFAAQAAGVTQVQALDARKGPTDAECEHRNGRFFSIDDAFREDAKEHPNGTLAWRIVKGAELSIKRVKPDESPDYMARFDEDERTIYLRTDLDPEREGHYLTQIGYLLELQPEEAVAA